MSAPSGSPGRGVFDRFIRGSGLSPMGNMLSFGVAFGGALAWWL
jgi:hypothetical protein